MCLKSNLQPGLTPIALPSSMKLDQANMKFYTAHSATRYHLKPMLIILCSAPIVMSSRRSIIPQVRLGKRTWQAEMRTSCKWSRNSGPSPGARRLTSSSRIRARWPLKKLLGHRQLKFLTLTHNALSAVVSPVQCAGCYNCQ